MFPRRFSHGTSFPGRPILASATSGRTETAGRLFQLIRRPTSCVTGCFFVADMWHVAQVGAAQ